MPNGSRHRNPLARGPAGRARAELYPVPYALLKRQLDANPAPATDYTVRYWYYDLSARRPVQDAVQQAVPGGVSNFELALDALVPDASFCLGTTRREVRYAGDGQVYYADVANSVACVSTLTSIAVTATGTNQLSDATGQVQVSATGSAGPWLVRCARVNAWTPGLAEYYEELTVYAWPLTFPLTANQRADAAPGYLTPPLPDVPDGVSLEGRGPGGLAAGRYRVDVTDANGFTLGQDAVVSHEKPGSGGVTVLFWDGNPAGSNVASQQLLHGALTLRYFDDGAFLYQAEILPKPDRILLAFKGERPDYSAGGSYRASFYQPSTNRISIGTVSNANPRLRDVLGGLSYFLPAGEKVGFVTTGDVCSDGQGGVYVRPFRTTARPLRLENLILFHPDAPAETSAGVVVEVAEQADPDCPVLTFTLSDPAGTVVAANATGRFAGLPAGQYRVRVSSADAAQTPLSLDVTLRARYGLWRTLVFDDLENHVPCRVELWLRGFGGTPAALCGGPDPVVVDTQGLEPGPLQADLPDSVGTSLTLNLLTEPGELEDLVLEDRVCRVDFYYGHALKFRGYVQPETFVAPLLDGQQPITLIATCGLAALKDTDFAGHIGQELRGRRPLLHTLLHCLSRCDVALPVRLFSNRKAAEMATAEALELAGYTDRLGYTDEKGGPLDCRAVLDACCQALGGTLAQRDGMWQLFTPLEAATPTPGRAYGAGGTPAPAPPLIPAPAATVRPPEVATAAAHDWLWLEASQQVQRRAGWKSFSAETDTGFAKQAFRQGDYFHTALVWHPASTALQPVAGWVAGAGSGAPLFPLALAQAGGKAGEVAASWPRPATGSGPGVFFPTVRAGAASAYLESEAAPLLAGREGLAFRLTLSARFVALDPGFTGDRATVLVEIVSQDGAGYLTGQGHVFTVPLETGATRQLVTASVVLPIGLPVDTPLRPRLRLHPYQAPATGINFGPGGISGNFLPARGRSALLVESLVLELLPQHAEWDGAQTFTAVAPGGTVRPQEPLSVFHADVPAAAGLYAGNVFAFRRAVSRGVAGPTTAWERPGDVRPAPLLHSAALDVLALRANPSRVLTGPVRHRQTPAQPPRNPEFGDAVDAPHDIDGRRWFVASRRWHVRPALSEVALLEIGPGAFLLPPTYALPDQVLLPEFGVSSYGGEVFPDYLTTEAGEPLVLD